MDLPDWIATLSLALGSAWLSGINLYATVATLGLAHRFEFVHLPGDLDVLGQTWLIGVALALYAVEFVADKIPAVDSAWDVVHTFIRVPAGAIMAATAFTDVDSTLLYVAALVLGGGVAFTSHGAKAAVRAAANLSPEPFSNIFLSLIEDAFAIGSSVMLVVFPAVMLVVVIVGVVAAVWVTRRLWRFVSERRNATPDPRTSPPQAA